MFPNGLFFQTMNIKLQMLTNGKEDEGEFLMGCVLRRQLVLAEKAIKKQIFLFQM